MLLVQWKVSEMPLKSTILARLGANIKCLINQSALNVRYQRLDWLVYKMASSCTMFVVGSQSKSV